MSDWAPVGYVVPPPNRWGERSGPAGMEPRYLACLRCGALVYEPTQHDAWHREHESEG